MDPDSSPLPPREPIPDIIESTPAPVVEPAQVVEAPLPVESQNEASQQPAAISVNPVPPEPVVPQPQANIIASISAPFDPHSAERIDYLNTVLRPKAIAVRHAKMAEHLDRLVAHAREKGSIDHKEVRLFLIVGNATASRYLTTLVKQGRLVREEKIGWHNDVRYHAM